MSNIIPLSYTIRRVVNGKLLEYEVWKGCLYKKINDVILWRYSETRRPDTPFFYRMKICKRMDQQIDEFLMVGSWGFPEAGGYAMKFITASARSIDGEFKQKIKEFTEQEEKRYSIYDMEKDEQGFIKKLDIVEAEYKKGIIDKFKATNGGEYLFK